MVIVTREAGAPIPARALPADVAAKHAKYLDFALGGLQPTHVTATGDAKKSETRARSLQDFLDSRALIVSVGHEREVFTWDALISEVANKLGPVHLDDEVPVALDEIGSYRVLGLNPVAYCVRSAAAVICGAAHEMLARVAVTAAHDLHAPRTRGMWIGSVAVGRGHDTPGEKPRFVAAEFVAFDLSDRVFLSGPDFELGIADGGRLQFKKLK